MGLRSALSLFSVFHGTMLTRFLNSVISLALLRTGLFNYGQTDGPRECYPVVVAICLAGFDEILTLQWGASQTGRPFPLETYGTCPITDLPGSYAVRGPNPFLQ